MNPVRVFDSGLHAARWNVAMSAALLELHLAGCIPDSVRFHRYPRSVLIGRHQDFDREIRAGREMIADLEYARRITGGGAIYMSPEILAWDVVVNRAAFVGRLSSVSECFGTAIAAGLSRLGVDARYRPPNDVVVDGRKISGSSGGFEGSTLMHQGTVLIAFDRAEMADALLAKDDADGRIALQARVTSFAEITGRAPCHDDVRDAVIAGLSQALDRTFAWAEPGREELDLAARLLADEIGTDEFVYGTDRPAMATRPGMPTAMAGVL